MRGSGIVNGIAVREPAGRRDRYREHWRAAFDERVAEELRPGIHILDIGAGSRPTIAVDARPAGSTYVGFDIAADELKKAPPGSYDEAIVGDVVGSMPVFHDRFELIVSWQVLEHVSRLDQAFQNLRAWLRPGGALIAQLSGKFSIFAIANQLIPHSAAAFAMHKLVRRSPDTVFPARYDHCYYSALSTILRPFSEAEIIPRYKGAEYLVFAPIVRDVYLLYEDWIYRRDWRNLATHYIVVARR